MPLNMTRIVVKKEGDKWWKLKSSGSYTMWIVVSSSLGPSSPSTVTLLGLLHPEDEF